MKMSSSSSHDIHKAYLSIKEHVCRYLRNVLVLKRIEEEFEVQLLAIHMKKRMLLIFYIN